MTEQKKNNGQLLGEMHTDIKWITKKLDSLDKKYAKKWVQNVMTGLITMILMAFIMALIGLVFVPKAHAITQFYINLFG